MKIKKCFTAFVAGVMTFVTVTCAQIGAYLAQVPVLKPIGEQLGEIWTGVSIKGENAVVRLKYLAVHHNLQWGDKREAQWRQNDKMLPELRQSRAMCRRSGILLWADEVLTDAGRGAPQYRESG